jgi:Mor family transcriptional regulator
MCGGFKWKYECQENTDKEQVIKRLTPEQNNEIIKKRKEGFTVKELAKEYSKSSSQITRIVRNKV